MELTQMSLQKKQKKCLNCQNKIQLSFISQILFKDAQLCLQCTQKIQIQNKQKKEKEKPKAQDLFQILKKNSKEQLILFLSSHDSQLQSLDIVGYTGNLHMSQLQRLTTLATKIKVFNFRCLFFHHIDQPKFDYPKYKINFQNIIKFELKGQKLFNIEFLQNIRMPVIQNLSLWDNSIVQLKSMKKLLFSRLEQFHISHNQVKNLSPFQRCSFNKLRKISISFKQGKSFQEYKSLLKLSAQRLRELYLNYIQFIEFYDASLKKKYEYIKIVSMNNCQYSIGRKDL